MTPAPPTPPTPRTPSRAHVERNVRLDPQGIYGTRSARRQSQLRRRRQLQNGLLWAIGAVAIGALGRWALQPRQSARASNETFQLPFRPASVPLALASSAPQNSAGELLFTSQSGGLWRAKIGKNAVFAAPRRVFSGAAAPAAALLMTSRQIFWPGGDGVLVALDAATGRVQWRAALPSALVTRPALVQVENRAIVVAGDDAGNLAAFDAQSGALKWKKSLGGALGEGIGVLKAKKVAVNVSALSVGSGGASIPGNIAENSIKPAAASGLLVPMGAGAATRGGLVCLDAQTGAVRWNFPGDARSQSAGFAAPAIWNDQVFWCNDEGAVVCLDGATGRKIWKNFAAPLTSVAGATSAISNSASLNSASSTTASSATASSATASSATAVISDLAMPAPAKSSTASDDLVMLRGAPSVVPAAGVVALGGNDGVLRAFDLATGAARWTAALGGALHFTPQKLLFEGKNALLVTGEMPEIFLIDAREGTIIRHWTTPYRNSYGVVSLLQNAYSLDADGHLQVAPLQ